MMRSTPRAAFRSVCGILGILLPAAWPCAGLAEQPEIWKVRTPDYVAAGDPVSVTIRIRGDAGQLPTPLPFDGVLLIDQSGSMQDSDPNDKRIDAAESFVDCVAASTRLAVVTYGDSAAIVQGLTSDKPHLHAILDGLRGQASGETHMYSAIGWANEVLTSGGQSDRKWFAILLTDGWDTSGRTDAEFLAQAQEGASYGITYYGVALGAAANLGLLYMISDVTGGEAYFSQNVDQLGELYGKICQQTSYQAKTRSIVLEEYLNTSGSPRVAVVPGSVSTSIESVSAEDIQQFEQTGQILASIGELGPEEERTISFQVVSECLTPDAAPGTVVDVSIDDPASMLHYAFGLSEGTIVVPRPTFQCGTPGDISVKKTFDAGTMTLSIDVKNNWLPDPTGARDNSLRNVVVFEQPNSYFQVKRASVNPAEDAFFSGVRTDMLEWRIPKLAPKETVHLTAVLEATLCSAENQPPLAVDVEKVAGMGPRSFVAYVPPSGSPRRTLIIPNTTTTIGLVDDCPGRYDRYLEAAFRAHELEVDLGMASPAQWDTHYVHARDESGMVFVDSPENGLWDGTGPTISQRIRGAIDTRNVKGQGDVPLDLAFQNVIWVGVANTGRVLSPKVPEGVVVQLLDKSIGRWNVVGKSDLPPIPRDQGVFVKIPFPIGPLDPQYVSTYKLKLDDILRLIAQVDAPMHSTLANWFMAHPTYRSMLVSLGETDPDHVRPILQYQPALLAQFDQFMASHPKLSWGKPSVLLRVAVPAVAPEKHTNNNSTTEVVVVKQ